jgi:hypothetical protein
VSLKTIYRVIVTKKLEMQNLTAKEIPTNLQHCAWPLAKLISGQMPENQSTDLGPVAKLVNKKM